MGNHPNRSKVKAEDWPSFLRSFRTRHGLTQAQLADKLMVSRRLVENWEGAVNIPPAYLKITLTAIAERLGTR